MHNGPSCRLTSCLKVYPLKDINGRCLRYHVKILLVDPVQESKACDLCEHHWLEQYLGMSQTEINIMNDE